MLKSQDTTNLCLWCAETIHSITLSQYQYTQGHTHTERDKHSHTDTSGHERCSKCDRFLGEISIRLMPLLHPTVLWHTQSCNSQDIFPCPWERPDTTTHTHTHTHTHRI